MEATATAIKNCTICLDEIKEANATFFGREITLKCSHSYHKVCIQQWFDVKHKCPLCQRDISEVDILSQQELNHLLAKALVAGDYDGRRQAEFLLTQGAERTEETCLLYTSPSPRDLSTSRMPSSA